jgi:hypothetical protein
LDLYTNWRVTMSTPEIMTLKLVIERDGDECVTRDVRGRELARAKQSALKSLVGQFQALDNGFDAAKHTQAGQTLFQTLGAGDTFQRYLVQARQAGQYILVQLQVTDPDLQGLQWEALHDGQNYLALDENISLVRFLPLVPLRPFTIEKLPVRLLLTLAPGALHSTQICQNEERWLRQLEHKAQGVLEIKTLRNTTPIRFFDEVLQASRRGSPYHIWHHCGDGRSTAQALALRFVGRDIELENLRQILGQVSPGLHIVVLNIAYEQWHSVHAWRSLTTLPVSLIATFGHPVSDFARAGVLATFCWKVFPRL